MNKVLLIIKNSFITQSVVDVCIIVGKNVINFNSSCGRFAIFTWRLFAYAINKRFFFKNFINSIYVNGFCSIPVVGLTGVFTGAVLTLQLFNSLKMFGVENTIPYIVLVALMKELGPVLCSLMIVSRVGSSMSAEIGSMATNNQIDVLTSMSINKFRFLYFPKILSMTIIQPFLTTIAIITGVIGSYFVAISIYGFTDKFFINLIFEGFSWNDYFVGVIKGFVFGIIISVIACYKGNKTKEGAVGIKDTTISTVVLSCIYILIFNFVLTWLLS